MHENVALEPTADPKIRWFSVAVSLLFLLGGIVGIHDLWVHFTGAPAWLTPVTKFIAAKRFRLWLLGVAAALFLLALILLVQVFLPRARTHRRLTTQAAVWMRPIDIARMCSGQVERVPGVVEAHTVVTPKSVTITVEGDMTDPSLKQRVLESVEFLLEAAPTGKVSVFIQPAEVVSA
ncbi:MAG: hypothetical protein SPI77_00645 [Corynebacterium sp.]|nr:hypothetical protein [Corynebacterium sp.]